MWQGFKLTLYRACGARCEHIGSSVAFVFSGLWTNGPFWILKSGSRASLLRPLQITRLSPAPLPVPLPLPLPPPPVEPQQLLRLLLLLLLRLAAPLQRPRQPNHYKCGSAAVLQCDSYSNYVLQYHNARVLLHSSSSSHFLPSPL